MDEVPTRDLVVVSGDFNAYTGPADINSKHVNGSFAVNGRCANGEHSIDLAFVNRLTVSSTNAQHPPRHLVQHPPRHLVSWYYNGGVTRNEIYQILFKPLCVCSLLDYRSLRGAESGNEHGSDHVMVRDKVRLRL